MISIADFEDSKENVNQLKQGRKLKDLNDMNNEKERKRRAGLLNSSSPFEEFVDYIDWTNQHFPTGHSSIMKKTEEACRLYRKDPRYKNHPRYVELWLSILKHQQEPSELFKYLIKNEIGLELGQFYEQYAGYHESCKKFEEADEIYRLGIGRKVQGLERLVRLYNDFLLRRSEAEEVEEVEARVEPRVESRLEPIAKVMPKAKTTKSSFQVFQGDDDVDIQDQLFPQGSTNDFQSKSHQIKENEPSRDQWAGSTLKMSRKAPTREKVAVFKDDDIEPNDIEPRKKVKVLAGKQAESRKAY